MPTGRRSPSARRSWQGWLLFVGIVGLIGASLWLLWHVRDRLVPAPPLTGKLLSIHAIDVGQGDSYLIVTPEKKTILIDAGPAEAGPNVVRFLQRQGVTELDLVIATHPHADHIGGMGYVLKAVKVKNFLDSGQEHTTLTYRRMLEAVKKQVGRLTVAQAGQKFNLDHGITLSVLGPRQPWLQNVSGSDLNANSIVARLDYGQFSMLLTGDAEDETEDRLLADGAPLRVTALKVAHHGSRHSSQDRFLRAVRPSVAVISCGATNRYGHPTQATLDRLRRLNVALYRTDLHGDITLTTNGQDYRVTTARQAAASDMWRGCQPRTDNDTADEMPRRRTG
ncbi:MAG: ComEC/Rec2 family competence protein [Acidobacteriota bacterium]